MNCEKDNFSSSSFDNMTFFFHFFVHVKIHNNSSFSKKASASS